MIKLVSGLLLAVILLAPVASVHADVWVNGYYRSNGTYVKGHYRSSPDSSPYNNWSYPGNTNPYTGKKATGNPSTYLKNYYGSSSSSNSSGSTYTPSTYTPSYTLPTYTSTYTPTFIPSHSSGSSYSSYLPGYSSLLEEIEKAEKETERKNKKIYRTIPWIVKKWADENPSETCKNAPLTLKDRKTCDKYRKSEGNSKIVWNESDKVSEKYNPCGDDNFYYLDACPSGHRLECVNGAPWCKSLSAN